MIRQRLTWIFSVLIMAGFSSTTALAQSGYRSEQDMIRQAERFFSEKKFDKALPLFSTIVSNKPADPKMNYYLGACIIEAGTDKTEALRFLETATQSPLVPVDAWFYLGKAFHASYRYEEALTAYEAFRINTSKATWNNLQGEQLITMCKNGIAATNNIEKTAVHRILKKEVMAVNDLSSGYKFNEPSGRLLKLPKEYELKETKGKPECEYLFLNAEGNRIVYANKEGKSKNGFDIYHVEKDAKGLWGFPKLFGPDINSSADEAYPVISNDGKTLYFSSNGPTSTGGYDIFKSELNATTGKWSAPVNMGTPVNSPGDDFYYIQSKDNTYAYFSSGRESIPGKCNLYKVSVVDETRNFASIKGVFNCPSKLELVEAKITIYDARDGSILSEFKTPSRTGQYAVKLPVPSTLIYQVQLTGFESHKGQIELKENIQRDLSQEILLIREESGREKMTIITISPEQMAEKTNPEHQEQPLVSVVKKQEDTGEPKQLLEVSEKNRVFIPEQAKTSNSDKTATKEASAKSKAKPSKENNEPIVTIIKPDSTLTAEQIMEQTLMEQDKSSEKKKKPGTKETVKPVNETAAPITESPASSKETTPINETTVTSNETLQLTESAAAPLVSVVNTEKKKNETVNPALARDKSECIPVQGIVPQLISGVSIPRRLDSPKGSTAMVTHPDHETTPGQPDNKQVRPDPLAADIAVPEPSVTTNENKGIEIVSTLESKKNEYILTSMFAGKELVFRVQLGVFGKKTEEELKKKFAEKGITNIVIQQNEKGLLQVLMGDENNYGDALALKETMVNQGMKDAFVVVFTSGVQVPIDLVVKKDD